MMKKCTSKAKVFSSVPVISSAIYDIMTGEDPNYVKNIYRQLVLGDTKNIPPICHSVLRQLITGKITTRGGYEVRLENFLRFLPVFRESHKNLQKLILRDEEALLNEVRKNLSPWFSFKDKAKVNVNIENIKSNLIDMA